MKRMMLNNMRKWKGWSTLRNIHTPTLVITGAEDRLIPAENSRLIASRIPAAQLVLLPDASHFFWIEKPQETADALISFFAQA